MRNAIILHGTGSSPNHFWHPWLKDELEREGFSVWVPQLPDAEVPVLSKWLPFVLENGKIDKETVLIGHSAGCPLILSILENLNIRIPKVVLVAGFGRRIGEKDQISQTSYDWEKIKNNVSEIIYINSDNDPWGCDDREGRFLLENLGGIQVILKGEGHMGSEKFHQPYKQFPLLLKLII